MKKLTSIMIGTVAICAIAASAALAGKPTLAPNQTPDSYCNNKVMSERQFMSYCFANRSNSPSECKLGYQSARQKALDKCKAQFN